MLVPGAMSMAMVSAPAGGSGAVDWDGTNDVMKRGANFSSISLTSFLTYATWLRIDGGDGTLRQLVSSNNNAVNFKFGVDNKLSAIVTDATGALSLNLLSSTAILASASWFHVAVVCSTNFSAGNKLAQMYLNGVSDSPVVTDLSVAFSIGYATPTDWTFFDIAAGGRKWNGCSLDTYFNSDAALDLSTNISKFYLAGKPVNLGPTGALPSGSQPVGYFHIGTGGVPNTYATNLGYGGGMTLTGSLDLCSSTP